MSIGVEFRVLSCLGVLVVASPFQLRIVGGVLVLVAALVDGTVSAAREPGKPNIVLILADDLGYSDVGFQGGKDIPTPHLDNLARGGVRCANGYVSHPFCSPTRAGIMTGRYQHRFGHENNPVFDPANPKLGLPLDQVTIADALKAAGYVTGAVGKWHLGAEPRFLPTRRGFTEFFGFPGGGHDYFQAQDQPGAREYLTPILRGDQSVTEKEYLTRAFSREAVAFITHHKDRPFFLYLAYNAVHTPLQAPPTDLARVEGIDDVKRKPYAAMLQILDEGVGQVLDALKRSELERDTLVVFLSDNGGPPPANGSRNEPLRGAKGTLYEGGVRVPFVFRWPGVLAEGSSYDQPVSSIDLMPTAVALAGGKTLASSKLDGVDLMPYLTAKASGAPHPTLFWRADGGRRFAVREGRFKMIKNADAPFELYDLESDLGEVKDLSGTMPKRLESMLEKYHEWNSSNVPPLWSNPPAAATKKVAGKKAADKKAAGRSKSDPSSR